MSDDDGVIVTDSRPQRSDNTVEQHAAEERVEHVIKDLLTGDLISRRSATNVRDAADKAIKGADLVGGIGRAF